MSKCVSKHLVEVRFKPSAAFLDKRGQIAESMTGKLFDFWSISDTRIDFENKDCKHISGFLSFRNAGFSSVYPMTVEYFVENAKDFIQRAWIFFGGTNEVTRIGVRSIFLSEVSDFENTLRAYREHFLKLNDEDVKEFGGQLVDVGFPLNFVEGDKRFNILTGPMEKAQALTRYGNEEGIPETAIFLDFDYFKGEFGKEFRLKEALNFIEEGTRKAREINGLICKWILKGLER